MALFKYTAVNRAGKTVRGRIDAHSADDLEARISKLGLSLVSSDIVKSGSRSGSLFFQRSISRDELAQFCFYIERLVAGGVPLLEGLSDVRDSVSNPSLRHVVGLVIQEIESGTTLSVALSKHPKIFDQIFVSLVAAGEKSGELDKVLRNLGESIKWQAAIVTRTKKVFRYPLMALLVVTGAAYFLLAKVVPQIVKVLTSLGQELPPQTTALIATAEFVEERGLLLIGGIAGVVVLFIVSSKFVPGVDYMLDKFKVRMPIFGSVAEKLILSRFVNVFGMLYASGITVVEGLRISRGAMGNKFLSRGMDGIIDNIINGATLFKAFNESGLFPPLVLRMIRLGETTGGVDSAMIEIKNYFDKDAEEAIETAQEAINPIMMLIVAGLLIWVVLAVYGPLYDIVGQVQG